MRVSFFDVFFGRDMLSVSHLVSLVASELYFLLPKKNSHILLAIDDFHTICSGAVLGQNLNISCKNNLLLIKNNII